MTTSHLLKSSCQLCDQHQRPTSCLLLAIKAGDCPISDWVELLLQHMLFQCLEHGVLLVDTPPTFQLCPAFAAPPDTVTLCVACASSDWSDAPAMMPTGQLDYFAAALLSGLRLLSLVLVLLALLLLLLRLLLFLLLMLLLLIPAAAIVLVLPRPYSVTAVVPDAAAIEIIVYCCLYCNCC